MSIIKTVKTKYFNKTVELLPNQSVEEVIVANQLIKKKFEDVVSTTFIKPPKLTLVDFVETKHFNNLFDQLSTDLDVCDESIDQTAVAIDKLKDNIIDSFDNLYLEFNSLNSQLNASAISNNAGFSNIKTDTISFNNNTSIDTTQSNSLFVDTYENKISLPISKIENVNLSNARLVINSQSNGDFNGSTIQNCIDSNYNTFVDYRQDNSVSSLLLSFNIELQSVNTINQLGLAINNFDTQNWLEVVDIKTSIDGITFGSVFKNIDFYKKYLYNKVETSSIILNPEFNNLSDIFILDFPSSKCRYIQIVIKQNNIHPITNDFRIGLREVFINKVFYANSGSVIIKHPLRLSNVDTLGIKASMLTKIDSELLNAKFEISFDGNSWTSVNTVDFATNNVVYINSPWLKNNLPIDNTGRYIYIKIIFNKAVNDVEKLVREIFADNISLINEYVSFPQSLPYNIQLGDIPNQNSVKTYAVPFISIGNSLYNNMLIGSTTTNVFNYTFRLPFNLDDLSNVFIGGFKLTRYSTKYSLLDGDNLGYCTYGDILFINIKKSSTTTSSFVEEWLSAENPVDAEDVVDPFLMTANLPIKISIDAEIVTPSTRTIELKYISDGIKDNFKIIKQRLTNGSPSILDVYDIIPKNTVQINLSTDPIVPTMVDDVEINPIEIEGSNRVDFIDGFSEFIGHEYAYSVDFVNKILYMRNPYESSDITVHYKSYDQYEFSSEDFEIEQYDGVDYLVVNPLVFDRNSRYYIEYNIAVLIPSSSYSLTNNTLSFTDQQIMTLFYGNTNLLNKKIKISYSKYENLQNTITELLETLTPILYNLSIIYSVKS